MWLLKGGQGAVHIRALNIILLAGLVEYTLRIMGSRGAGRIYIHHAAGETARMPRAYV